MGFDVLWLGCGGLITGVLMGGVLWLVLRDKTRQTQDLNDRLIQTQQDLVQAIKERDEQKVRLEAQRETLAAKEKWIQQVQGETERAIKGLCAEALQKSNSSFLELAQNLLKNFQTNTQASWQTQQEKLGALMNPIASSLKMVDEKLQEMEKTRQGAYESLRQQVAGLLEAQGALHQQTTHLVHALKTPHIRGRWGEVQLRRVVEMAGMLPYCDFEEQASFTDQTEEKDKRMRPDLVIKLPGNKNIVIDAKVPLASYLESIETSHEAERQKKLKEHAQHVRAHMKALSQKAYWTQFDPSPELVLLFLPSEFFFTAALEHDPELLAYSAESKVILATPMTLIVLLKTIAFGWRQENMAENAQKITTLGRELYKRLGDMGHHFTQLGRQLNSSVQSYNQAIGSLEHRVLPKARQLNAAGGETIADKEIPTLSTLTTVTRLPQATEQLSDSTPLSATERKKAESS